MSHTSRPCLSFLTQDPEGCGWACCAAPSLHLQCFLDLGWGPALPPPIVIPVSPAGHEEERGAACGRAVCGSALAGRVVSAVYAGGGTTDDPRKAAILTAACPATQPALEDPLDLRPAWSGHSCHPARKRSLGQRLPSRPPSKKPRPPESGPCPSVWSPVSALTPSPCGSQWVCHRQGPANSKKWFLVCVLSGHHCSALGVGALTF